MICGKKYCLICGGNKTKILNGEKMNDLDCAIDFIAELILLCEMPKEVQQKVLRPIKIGVGDYMGSGYAFTDAYNRIFDEFLYNCSEELWQKIRIALDNKQIK